MSHQRHREVDDAGARAFSNLAVEDGWMPEPPTAAKRFSALF